MAQDPIERKIRALEALATRPGTVEEGEIARSRAIELSEKYNIPSIFTQKDYTPPPVQERVKTPPVKSTKLHKNVVRMEDVLRAEGWNFVEFQRNARIYANPHRPSEEIHMKAHNFGEFTCQHYYRQSDEFRPIGNHAEALSYFFRSLTYRLELWEPLPQQQRSNRNYDNFYDPLLDKFDPKYGKPAEPKPEPIKEEVKTEPTPEPIVEEVKVPEPEPIDELDELLRQSYQEEYEVKTMLAERLF